MSEPLPPNFWRALNRPATLRSTHDHLPAPRLSLPEPVQPAPALAQQSQGEAPRTGCPLVRITHRRVRLFDVDGKYAAVKDVLDGCVYAGLLCGDKEGQIDLEVRQEKVSTFKAEETLIEIVYPD